MDSKKEKQEILLRIIVEVDNSDVVPPGSPEVTYELKPNNRKVEARLKELGLIVKEGNRWVADLGRGPINRRYSRQISPLECAYVFYINSRTENNRRVKIGLMEYTLWPDRMHLVLYKPHEKKKEPRGARVRAWAKIGIHTANQLFNSPQQRTLFSEKKINDFANALGMDLDKKPNSYGMKVYEKPNSYGMNLNQSELRVLQGILKAFSDTNYQGDELIEKDKEWKLRGLKVNSEKGQELLSRAYENIKSIPLIRLTQADIIRLSGYDGTHGEKTHVLEALDTLGTKQFFFYWSRLKYDHKGRPMKDKTGNYEKQEIEEVGTLFRIKTVKNEQTKEFQYYEISPSAVVLDQINNYFLIIPENWMEEVKELTGKRASSYIYSFLLWLRKKYEEMRKGKAKRKDGTPLIIRISWEEIAEILRMPESMYKRNRARSLKIINDALEVAQKLGYLQKVEDDGAVNILYLNEEFYPQPGKLS